MARNITSFLKAQGLTNADTEDYGTYVTDKPKEMFTVGSCMPYGYTKADSRYHKYHTLNKSEDVCPVCGSSLWWRELLKKQYYDLIRER